MPLIHLDMPYLLIAILVACPLLQAGAALVCLWIPDRWYAKDHAMFRLKRFEKDGKFYDRVFKISRWKKYLPDGGRYKKKHLRDLSVANLEKYVIESKRAELSHVWGLIPFVLFILFTPSYVWPLMAVYALLVNLPCWMAQRYNRPRVIRLLNAVRHRVSQT
jgi:glycosyl-4,4'-diaponeurosporenoate acyltransferase